MLRARNSLVRVLPSPNENESGQDVPCDGAVPGGLPRGGVQSLQPCSVRRVSTALPLVSAGYGQERLAPASYPWLRLNFAERQRGLAIGLYMTGTKIGPAIGTPLAVLLIMNYDWRMMFVLIGLGGLIRLIPWMLLVNDRQPVQSVRNSCG
jgi:Major Facilitator Superfamily